MHSGLNDLAVGLPHSEIPGSKLGYQLPWAYRRFLRPSSPLDAKTSTVCPFTLGHVNRIPSDRLASDRRSLTDAHAGPSCVWTSDLPHSPRRRVLQAASQANLDRCLPSNRAVVMRAQPARLRDLSTIQLMHFSQNQGPKPLPCPMPEGAVQGRAVYRGPDGCQGG